MANRECNGHWFRVGSDRYYECFWDSTVLKNDDCPIQGSTCLNCKRLVDGANCGEPRLRTCVLRQALLPGGRVVTFEAETKYKSQATAAKPPE